MSGRDVNDDRVVRLIHSSDLHLDDANAAGRATEGGNLDVLAAILHTARLLSGDVTLLVGDVFDNNRVSQELIDGAVRLLAEAHAPVVILPGNHDCLEPNSVYYRGAFAAIPHVYVLGTRDDSAARFPQLDLEIWGEPHRSYGDMVPLDQPRPRSTRWQVAAAHGHWISDSDDWYRSYLISPSQVIATSADYVALGHWDRWAHVGQDFPAAYYSGAPDVAGTVNLVRFSSGRPDITREVVMYPASGTPAAT
ncbi:MAG: hypothetical protein EXR68_03585 [Dehalococcoidia bacterium]|nr:hypothetical protein [Dehalococcoidia bacterium]